MRFNHMELTFENGTLDDVMRTEVDRFYGSIFGWTGLDVDIVGQKAHYLRVDDDWADLARRADAIQRDDLYTLRLRTLDEPAGPPTPKLPPAH